MASTRQRLLSELPDDQRPIVHLHAMCHSRLQVVRRSRMIRPHMPLGLFLHLSQDQASGQKYADRTCDQSAHLQKLRPPRPGIPGHLDMYPMRTCGRMRGVWSDHVR